MLEGNNFENYENYIQCQLLNCHRNHKWTIKFPSIFFVISSSVLWKFTSWWEREKKKKINYFEMIKHVYTEKRALMTTLRSNFPKIISFFFHQYSKQHRIKYDFHASFSYFAHFQFLLIHFHLKSSKLFNFFFEDIPDIIRVLVTIEKLHSECDSWIVYMQQIYFQINILIFLISCYYFENEKSILLTFWRKKKNSEFLTLWEIWWEKCVDWKFLI